VVNLQNGELVSVLSSLKVAGNVVEDGSHNRVGVEHLLLHRDNMCRRKVSNSLKEMDLALKGTILRCLLRGVCRIVQIRQLDLDNQQICNRTQNLLNDARVLDGSAEGFDEAHEEVPGSVTNSDVGGMDSADEVFESTGYMFGKQLEEGGISDEDFGIFELNCGMYRLEDVCNEKNSG
jgi:hypothetical protein